LNDITDSNSLENVLKAYSSEVNYSFFEIIGFAIFLGTEE